MIRFYNTWSKKKEEFHPFEKGKVKMYHCGPTVYGPPHIGNYRAYLFADVLRRYFEFKGFQVTQVINITDVDDKTIRDSRKEGIPIQEFTQKYTKIFFQELETLRIKKAHHYPRATEYISQMVKMIQKLEKNGLTYCSEGSIYFRIRGFENYGKLSNLDVEGLKEGVRIDSDEYDKESPRDFALWKAWVESDGDVFWETELGKGRPGWHIECSAMSTHHLGETFDLHTGGIDLVFPHHENEIAQAEGATKKSFVRYWLHNEHLLLDGKKISKSLGNVIHLSDLLEEGYEGEVIRYALINSHYRTRFNFITPDSLIGAREAIKRLRNFKKEMLDVTKKGSNRSKILEIIQKKEANFEKHLDEDLNIPGALGSVFSMIKELNGVEFFHSEAMYAVDFLKKVDSILAVLEPSTKEMILEEEILQLIEERKMARANKNFQKSDEIRDLLEAKGILIKDTLEGTRWVRI